jgi:hypothetical protein
MNKQYMYEVIFRTPARRNAKLAVHPRKWIEKEKIARKSTYPPPADALCILKKCKHHAGLS